MDTLIQAYRMYQKFWWDFIFAVGRYPRMHGYE